MSGEIDRFAAGQTLSASEIRLMLTPFLGCTPATVSVAQLVFNVTNQIGAVDQACVSGIWNSMTVDDVASALAVFMTDATAYSNWVRATFAGCLL